MHALEQPEPPEKPALGRAKRLALALGMPLALLVLFVLAAPLLLGGVAGRAVEDAFAEQYLGRLELGHVDLAWTQAQSLTGGRLLDPEGRPVASFSATLPTLFELARGGGRRIGRVRVELAADLVEDDAGTTNLQRALAARSPDAGDEPGPESGGGEPGGGESGSASLGLGDLELDLEVLLTRLSWSDASTRALAEPLALEAVRLTAALTPGEPLEVGLSGRVRAETDGVLELRATLAELGSPAVRLDLECDLSQLPTGLVDGLAGLGGELHGLLGPTLDLRASGSGTPGGGQFELQLESSTAHVGLSTQLAGGDLTLAGDLSLALRPERLNGWIGPSLPEGLSVRRLSQEPLTATLELSVPAFGAWLAQTSAGLPQAQLAVSDLELGDWRVASADPEAARAGAARTWTAVHAGAELDTRRGGTLTLGSRGAEPLDVALQFAPDSESGDLALGTANLSLLGVPTRLVDQLAGLDGLLTRLTGTGVDLEVALPEAAAGLTEGSLSLSSSQLDLRLLASYTDGLLEVAPAGEGPVLRYRSPGRLLHEFAPELESVALLGELQLLVETLELPLGPWRADEIDLDGLLDAARARATLQLGALEFTHELTDGSPVPVTCEAIELVLQLGEGATRAALAAGVQDSEGRLTVQLEVADLTPFVEDSELEPVVLVAARAEELSTLMVDVLAERDGLLVEMLGPQVSLRADGQYPARGQAFEIELESPKANLEFEGTLQEGVIVAGEDQQLTATAPLGPLFSSRVVGRLVPLLVGITKAPEADPVLMRVERFSLPLDGDLAKLNCDVRLELGAVSYQLLPGFQGAIETGTGGDSRRRTSHIAPLDITVRDGLVTYDKTPLKIDGAEVLVGGTFDLLSGTLKMTTLVPLKNLGRGVGRELEKARDFLDPALAVPIEIGGSITRPTINLGKSFLDTLLPGTVRGALRGGLQELFGRNPEKEAEEERKKAEKKARRKARREAEEAARKEGEEPL